MVAGGMYYLMQQRRHNSRDCPTRLAILNEDYGKKNLAVLQPPRVATKQA